MKTPRFLTRQPPASPSPFRPARNIPKLPFASPSALKTSHPIPHAPRNSPPPLFPPISTPLHHSKTTLPSPPKLTPTVPRLPRSLPPHLIPHLHSQKQAVLHALQHPPLSAYESSPYSLLHNQLTELIKGTTHRHEGNSCLILGPRGSGKSRLVDGALSSIAFTSIPIIVRLSAHIHTTDRLAMRAIALQVQQQLGASASLLPNIMGEQGQEHDVSEADDGGVDMDIPPSSHLPGLIAALPGLGRPVIIVLDGFDGFAAHARQALLYCLLDTVQACRGGSTSGEHGLLVIGVSSRVDCLTLLEKRVKSRFSHRIMRVSTPSRLEEFLDVLRGVLNVQADDRGGGEVVGDWRGLWMASVQEFLADKDVLRSMNETFAFGKDLRVLFRLMMIPVVNLTPNAPWLTAAQLTASVATQRCPKRFSFLESLPYPHIALLIAAAHTQTAGHDTFTFEMLHERFTAQVRVSASAPVQAERGGVGLGMMNAFEHLVSVQVFQTVAAPSTHVSKEFVKYRCGVGRDDVKGAVDGLGQTNLKKWFSRNQ
ncbi:hypothetical protein K439DRAFT_1327177 [Ramaria rubella]|nr:hypothetical protein K439DRAFT_1327177 [Ramaria rubella]